MNNKPIDGPEALRLLREVIGERPDYVYEPPEGSGQTCKYVWHDKASCVVAQVLARAGYSIDLIGRLDRWGVIDSARFYVDAIEIDADAAAILVKAQDVQDNSEPWSHALAAAERAAEQRGVSA